MGSRRSQTGKYRREYARFKRHLPYFLGEALTCHVQDDSVIYTEAEIIGLLNEKSGFTVKPKTLRRELEKLREVYTDTPLEPFYRFHTHWFAKHPPRIPRKYRIK
jgi:hypothetical protein